MEFTGIGRVFSTINEEQYGTIGAFWDELAEKHGRMNLRGLGYNWSKDSITYVIGLKEGLIHDADCTVQLPDDGWISVRGRTERLGELYGKIYEAGALLYEIEMFSDEGDCEILYYR